MLGYAAPSSGYGAYSARSGEGVRNLYETNRYLTNKQRSKNKQTNKKPNKQTNKANRPTSKQKLNKKQGVEKG